MAIPLVGGARPLTATLMRALGLGDAAEFVTGNDSLVNNSIGAWTKSNGAATLDRSGPSIRTTSYPGATTNSMKFLNVSANEYIELAISGTFKAGKQYWAQVWLGAAINTQQVKWRFGLIGTDDVESLGVALPWTATGDGIAIAIPWTPSADRTGVKVRLTNVSATETTYLAWCRVYQAIEPKPFIEYGNHLTIPPFLTLGAGSYFNEVHTTGVTNFTGGSPGFFGDINGTAGLQCLGAFAGLQATAQPAFPEGNLSMWGEGTATPGDLADVGVNIEAGVDYLGINVSEKDSATLQFYADVAGGYMLQLRDRGSNLGWASVGSDGVNARIPAFFDHSFTVSGTQTTGTNKGGVGQVWHAPHKMIIDEVRIHLGTAPTGQTFIVDVNAAGTTIFTTQANRPTIAISGTDANSGTPDGGTSIAKDTAITFDVDQIGSGTAGSDLTVMVRGRYIW